MSYRKRLLIPVDGANLTLYTKTHTPISNSYTRIVIGGRGPYVEMNSSQIILGCCQIPNEEEWRIGSNRAYYIEYRTIDSSYTKVYHQKKTVAYADYKIGLFYISLFDLVQNDGTNLLSDKFVKEIKKNEDQLELF